MKKSELIDQIAEKAGIAKNEAGLAFDAFVEVIIEGVKGGEKVAIAGLGIFEKRHRAARTGINPATQEKIQIAAKNVPAFKAAKHFKEEVF